MFVWFPLCTSKVATARGSKGNCAPFCFSDAGAGAGSEPTCGCTDIGPLGAESQGFGQQAWCDDVRDLAECCASIHRNSSASQLERAMASCRALPAVHRHTGPAMTRVAYGIACVRVLLVLCLAIEKFRGMEYAAAVTARGGKPRAVAMTKREVTLQLLNVLMGDLGILAISIMYTPSMAALAPGMKAMCVWSARKADVAFCRKGWKSGTMALAAAGTSVLMLGWSVSGVLYELAMQHTRRRGHGGRLDTCACVIRGACYVALSFCIFPALFLVSAVIEFGLQVPGLYSTVATSGGRGVAMLDIITVLLPGYMPAFMIARFLLHMKDGFQLPVTLTWDESDSSDSELESGYYQSRVNPLALEMERFKSGEARC